MQNLHTKTRPRALMQNLHTKTRPRALMPQNLHTKWFDRAPWVTWYPINRHNYKRGKSSMIMDNMHQGYIFRECSVVRLVVQCYRFCWCCPFCLLTLLRISSSGWGGRYVHAVLCCYSCPLVCVWGGLGLTWILTVKRIVTLHWNQTNLIYNNLSEKSKYSN